MNAAQKTRSYAEMDAVIAKADAWLAQTDRIDRAFCTALVLLVGFSLGLLVAL
jgi:hypothetical protein